MSEQVARNFIDALHRLEDAKDVDTLAGLYAAEASIGNILRPASFHGPDGARQFWTEYRGTFGQARSEFRSVIVSDHAVALEWTTRGTSFDGKPVHYEGVTILETDGDKVTRSSAYFDPSALGEQIT